MSWLLLLIILSFVPLLDLVQPGLPLTHDGGDHVARIANFYQNLSDRVLIPRWAANLNWGHGTPILMFLYPLPSYLASLFHFIGFSFVDSTKIVFGVTYIFSGLTMYLWVAEFLGKRAAFVSSMLYLFTPYRFVDLYVRGAIGEHVAFLFLPLILYFLLKVSKQYSYWHIIGGSLSLSGLILSHNAISLMFVPIILLYSVFLVWQSSQRRALLTRFGIVGIGGFGTSAFFWIPAFFEGKYTLRDIVTTGEYASRFVRVQELLYGQWSYGGSGQFSVQVGIMQWFVVISSLWAIYSFRKKRELLWVLDAALLFIFGTTLFLMTSASNFIWEIVTTLQKFQFPWRFFSISIFTTASLGGLLIAALPKRMQFALCCLLAIGLLFFNKNYWHAKGYLLTQENFFTGIYHSTTDTGESSPRWSVRFMEHPPITHMEVISGEAKIVEIKRISTMHEYQIDVREDARIRENTLYFPGWEVFIDSQKADIEFQDPAHRGLMTFFVASGKHTVMVKFKETKLRFFANMVTVASIIIVSVGGLILWMRKRR